jgi:hypothetical protein
MECSYGMINFPERMAWGSSGMREERQESVS